MSEAWRITSPAPLATVLDLAGPLARVRRILVYQSQLSDSVAIYRGDQPMAAAMLFPEGPHVRELCALFAPEAGQHMRRILRAAQLMARPVADSGVIIVARVGPRREAGRRMAAAAGFIPTDAEDGRLWIWRG